MLAHDRHDHRVCIVVVDVERDRRRGDEVEADALARLECDAFFGERVRRKVDAGGAPLRVKPVGIRRTAV
jgi:hypothetical protein